MNNRDHQSRIEQEQRTVSNAFLDIYVGIFIIIMEDATFFGFVSLHFTMRILFLTFIFPFVILFSKFT